jgi:hypothetical protein
MVDVDVTQSRRRGVEQDNCGDIEVQTVGTLESCWADLSRCGCANRLMNDDTSFGYYLDCGLKAVVVTFEHALAHRRWGTGLAVSLDSPSR